MDFQTLLRTSTGTPSRSGANRRCPEAQEEQRSWSYCNATTLQLHSGPGTRQDSSRRRSDNDVAMQNKVGVRKANGRTGLKLNVVQEYPLSLITCTIARTKSRSSRSCTYNHAWLSTQKGSSTFAELWARPSRKKSTRIIRCCNLQITSDLYLNSPQPASIQPAKFLTPCACSSTI
jgi:hypothetical protein